jgi:hypothetical protein
MSVRHDPAILYAIDQAHRVGDHATADLIRREAAAVDADRFVMTDLHVSRARNAGVTPGRIREMQEDCTADEYVAEIEAALRTRRVDARK